jgi:hypothetical protein
MKKGNKIILLAFATALVLSAWVLYWYGIILSDQENIDIYLLNIVVMLPFQLLCFSFILILGYLWLTKDQS